MNPSLRLAWGTRTAELSTADQRLTDALASVFAAFLPDDRQRPREYPVQPGPTRATLRAGRRGTEYAYDCLADAILELEDRVSNLLLGDCAHLLLHAGAVTDGRRTILVLGHSGAGKTTMTLELVRRGFRFLADEYTAIDVSARCIHPFPRSAVVKHPVGQGPVSRLPDGAGFDLMCEGGSRVFHLPADTAELQPHPIGELWLILPRFVADAEPVAQRLGTAEICARLLPGTFNFEGQEDRFWPTLTGIATRARACAIEYGDVAAGLDAVFALLGDQR